MPWLPRSVGLIQQKASVRLLAVPYSSFGFAGTARSFVEIVSKSKAREVPKLQDEEPAAFITWGASSEFSTNQFRTDAGGFGFKVRGGDEDEPVNTINFSEDRRSEDERIFFNPEDVEQTVTMRDIRSISFGSPDSEHEDWTFNLRPQGDS